MQGFCSLKTAVASADIFFIFLAFVLVFFQMTLSVLKMMLITRAQGVSFSFVKTARFTFCPFFLSSVTPLQSGGIAYQIYILKKSGCSFSRSVAIITFKSALNGLFLVVSLPLLFIYADSVFKSRMFSGFSNYVLAFYLAVAVFFYLIMFKNKSVKKLASAILFKNRGNKAAGLILKYVIKFLNSVEHLAKNYESFFYKHPSKTALASLIAVAEMGVYFLITPCLAMSLSPERDLAGLYATGVALSYILAYAPTPGGAGIAELSGISFALSWDGPVTALILLWRIVAHYAPAVVGGVLLFIFVGRDIPDKKGSPVFNPGPGGQD